MGVFVTVLVVDTVQSSYVTTTNFNPYSIQNILFFSPYLMDSVKKMTDCQGDCEGAVSSAELYEKLNAQGDKVRQLKTAKAEKVSTCEQFNQNNDLTL